MVVSHVVLDAPLPDAVAKSMAALTGCVAGAAMRADYLRTIVEAGLDGVEVVEDKAFGEMAMIMIPEPLLRMVEAAGVDVPAVARSVRSVTLRAWKRARTNAASGA